MLSNRALFKFFHDSQDFPYRALVRCKAMPGSALLQDCPFPWISVACLSCARPASTTHIQHVCTWGNNQSLTCLKHSQVVTCQAPPTSPAHHLKCCDAGLRTALDPHPVVLPAQSANPFLLQVDSAHDFSPLKLLHWWSLFLSSKLLIRLGLRSS